MNIKDAIKVLEMFTDDTEVELIFPDAYKVTVVKQPVKPLTEGAMAELDFGPEPVAFRS
jgi:hypothetical protein